MQVETFLPEESTTNQCRDPVFSKGNLTCKDVEEINELPIFISLVSFHLTTYSWELIAGNKR